MLGSDGDEIVHPHFAAYANSTEDKDRPCNIGVDEVRERYYEASFMRGSAQPGAEGSECRWFFVSCFWKQTAMWRSSI